MSAFVLDLAAPAADRAPVGGKGRALARMLAAGHAVPSAVAISSDALTDALCHPDVALALEAADPAAARAAVLATPLPDTLAEALRGHLAHLGPGPFAVRSSADDEDGRSHSFAGLHDTVLDVSGFDAVAAGVRQVWASAFSDRAVAYRRQQPGVDPLAPKMAVVIQQLVRADCAGVAFTLDPVRGDREVVVVEAVRGLGEALVSGRATPQRFRFARDGLSIHSMDAGEYPALAETDARRVAALALQLEREAGAPQDVEWAIEGDSLWLLQSRPITTVTRRDPGEDARAARQVWTNANVAELLPELATPMTVDVLRLYIGPIVRSFTDVLGLDVPLDAMVGRVAGRLYLSVNAITAIARALPFVRGSDFARGFGGDVAAMQAAIDRLRPEDLPASNFHPLRFLAGACRLGFWLLVDSQASLNRALDDYRAQSARLDGLDLSTLPDDALVPHITETLGYGRMPPSVTGALMGGMIATPALSALGARWLDDPAFGHRVLSAMGGLESAESGLSLTRLAHTARRLSLVGPLLALTDDDQARELLETGLPPDFRDEFSHFLLEHGHHARGEIDPSLPRWREQPAYVLRQVGALAKALDENRVADESRRKSERESELARAYARVGPLRRAILKRLLGRAERTLRVRENAKSAAMRRMAFVRRALLEAGGRLVAKGVLQRREDVFFLGLRELDQVLRQPPGPLHDTIQNRRAELERWRHLVAPSLVVGRFEASMARPPESAKALTHGVLPGLAVSAGVAVGRARVVLSHDTDTRLEPGEILVAPFTDPGWTPYFVGASAVVMDFGGLLSHGSIVAREYGLPAVVNVTGATARIRTGQLLRVDGNAGTVTLLEDPATTT